MLQCRIRVRDGQMEKVMGRKREFKGNRKITNLGVKGIEFSTKWNPPNFNRRVDRQRQLKSSLLLNLGCL